MNLAEKVRVVVQEHLPELVAGEMKYFVEKAEMAMKENEDLKHKLQVSSKELQKLRNEATTVAKKSEELAEWEISLREREEEFYKKLMAHEVDMMSYKMEEKNERLRATEDLMVSLINNRFGDGYLSGYADKGVHNYNEEKTGSESESIGGAE